MDWMAELNETIELNRWFELQASDAEELRDFILEKDKEIERLREALAVAAKNLDDFGAYTKANQVRTTLEGK